LSISVHSAAVISHLPSQQLLFLGESVVSKHFPSIPATTWHRANLTSLTQATLPPTSAGAFLQQGVTDPCLIIL